MPGWEALARAGEAVRAAVTAWQTATSNPDALLQSPVFAGLYLFLRRCDPTCHRSVRGYGDAAHRLEEYL